MNSHKDQQVQDMFRLIRQIPPGRVASYSAVGRALRHPTTGRIIGKWLATMESENDVPWWRVIAASGNLPIEKRHPILKMDQVDRLASEGVSITSQRVSKQFFWFDFE